MTNNNNENSRDQAKIQHILIVDDKETITITLKAGLKKLPNCVVTTAGDGYQALSLFEKQSFDLLFTDYDMPDMNGLDLALHVREHYPQTVVIMITANDSPDLYEQVGVTLKHIFNKPVKLNTIRQVALDVLSGAVQMR